MMIIFDYIFYRWFKLYKDRYEDADDYASLMVGAFQILFLINVISFGSTFLGLKRPHERYILVAFIVIFIINYLRYERNFNIEKLEKRWAGQSSKLVRLHWILMIVFLIVGIFAPFIHGYSVV